MKTLSQHIEERLIINKNFRQKEYFRPSTAQELCHYINSCVDELIDNDCDVLDMSNVDVSSMRTTSSDDNPLYQIFMQPCRKIHKKNITIDVSYWDVTKYARIDCIFFGCSCLEKVEGLETWDVSNAIDLSGMFSQCINLKSVNVSKWNLKKAKSTLAMFYKCRNLMKIDGIDTWEFAHNSRIDMWNMFYDCCNLKDIGDIEYWGNITGNIDKMFYNCNRLTPPSWYRKNI